MGLLLHRTRFGTGKLTHSVTTSRAATTRQVLAAKSPPGARASCSHTSHPCSSPGRELSRGPCLPHKGREAQEGEVLPKASQQMSSPSSQETTRTCNPILHFIEEGPVAQRGGVTMKLVRDSWGSISLAELFSDLDHSPAPAPCSCSPLGSQVVPASAQAVPLASLIPGGEGG